MKKISFFEERFFFKKRFLYEIVFSTDLNLSAADYKTLFFLLLHYFDNAENLMIYRGRGMRLQSQVISDLTGVSISSVKRSMQKLLESGLLLRRRQKGFWRYFINEDFFSYDEPDFIMRVQQHLKEENAPLATLDKFESLGVGEEEDEGAGEEDEVEKNADEKAEKDFFL